MFRVEFVIKNRIKKVLYIFENQKSIESALLILKGICFFLGISFGASIFFYNGHTPINALTSFLVIIIIPCIFLFLSIINQFSRKKPLIFVRSIFNFFLKLFGVLPETLSGDKFFKEFLLNGIVFFFGTFCFLATQVLFNDIVFGWTSSVGLKASNVLFFCDYVSLPWKYFFPEATISGPLVDKSLYFRTSETVFLKEISLGNQIESFSNWWKFFLMSIMTYNILPRILTFFVFNLKSNKKNNEKLESTNIFATNNNVSELFELNNSELLLYYSILKSCIELDILDESNHSSKEYKENWLRKWESNISVKDLLSRDDIVFHIKKNTSKKSIKFLVCLCEASLFTPYFKFDLSTDNHFDNLKYNNSLALHFLSQVSSLNSWEAKEVRSFYKEVKVRLKRESKSKFKALIGLALVSSAAIFLTGGFGAIATASLGKALGLAGVAAKTAAVALVGSGVLLMTSFENEGRSLILGCGKLFLGTKKMLDNNVFDKYLNSKDLIGLDLLKLEVFLEFKFFNEEFYGLIVPSIISYLDELKKKSITLGVAKEVLEKIQEIIIKIEVNGDF